MMFIIRGDWKRGGSPPKAIADSSWRHAAELSLFNATKSAAQNPLSSFMLLIIFNLVLSEGRREAKRRREDGG